MVGVLTLYRTSIGKKAVMAVTGLIGYGFVIAHMLGNLKMYQGPVAMNTYAEHLRTIGEPIVSYGQLLYVARIVLFTAVVLHIASAVLLTRQDRASRPIGYAGGRKNVQASFASLTLRWGGLLIFLFIIFHLLDLTIGTVNPAFIAGDPYHNVIATFSSPLVAGVYILAVGVLAIHLYHGVWSMFQTLGLNNARTDRWWRLLAGVSAVVLFVGFAAVPVGVLTGVLHA